jgi:hypothetical protein
MLLQIRGKQCQLNQYNATARLVSDLFYQIDRPVQPFPQ